jgi:threonine synthase
MKCNARYSLENRCLCDACMGILEVRHNYGTMRDVLIAELRTCPSQNIWRYRNFLPVQDDTCMITLYEGGTPLIRCENIGERIGFGNFWIKDESRNPSGAFKDRPMAVGVSKARELNRKIVVTASSGNAAASLATYAAKAGLKSYVFIPEHTPAAKVNQAIVNGAVCIKVRGSYSNAFSLAREAAEKYQWMNITTTFLNPYAIEGDKTVSYELFEQLDHRMPDAVLVPTGAGPLLFGIYKGFCEIRDLGLTDRLPRMIAVQAEGCAPIVRAFENGTDAVQGWEAPETIASAIADPLRGYEQDGELVLKIVRESRGEAVGVSDREIRDAVYELAENEGIYTEPAAAAGYAGLKKLLRKNSIAPSDTAVCIVTGHGLKDPQSVMRDADIPLVEDRLEALEGVLS